MGQMHGTRALGKDLGRGMGEGHKASVCGKCIGQVHVTRKWDMGKGMEQGHGIMEIEKGMGVWTTVWDKGMGLWGKGMVLWDKGMGL